jgi:hypothetical protein
MTSGTRRMRCVGWCAAACTSFWSSLYFLVDTYNKYAVYFYEVWFSIRNFIYFLFFPYSTLIANNAYSVFYKFLLYCPGSNLEAGAAHETYH